MKSLTSGLDRGRRLFASNPGFAWLTGGQSLAYLTIEMWYVVLPLLVLRLHGSAVWMGVIAASGFAPLLVGSAAAGWWVDHSSPRTVMLASAAGRAAVFALLAVLGLSGALPLPLLAVGCMALGLLGVSHSAGKRAMIPRVVSGGDLAVANSLDEGAFGAAEIVGTLVGGLVVAWSGPYAAMLVQAALLLGNAAAVLALKGDPPRPPKSAGGTSFREGFSFFLRDEPGSRALLWTTTLAVLVYGACTVFLSFQVFFYGSVLGVGAREVGWLVASVSVVGMVLSLLSGICVERFGVGRTMVAWCAVVCAGLFTTGLSPSVAGVVVGAGLLLGAAKALRGVFTTLLHWYVPQRLLGRVAGVFSTFAEGAAVFAALGTGVLGKTIGLRATFLSAGVVAVGAVLVCVLSPLRALDAKAPEPALSGSELPPPELADG